MSKIPALNQNKDFRRLYARGKSKVHPALVCYVMKNRVGFCRIGITASKKIGNAVQRNRARRVIREACRLLLPGIKPEYDIVFVARGRTVSCKSTYIYRIMQEQLMALRVMK